MYEQHKNLTRKPRTQDHENEQHYENEQQRNTMNNCFTLSENNGIQVLEFQATIENKRDAQQQIMR